MILELYILSIRRSTTELYKDRDPHDVPTSKKQNVCTTVSIYVPEYDETAITRPETVSRGHYHGHDPLHGDNQRIPNRQQHGYTGRESLFADGLGAVRTRQQRLRRNRVQSGNMTYQKQPDLETSHD